MNLAVRDSFPTSSLSSDSAMPVAFGEISPRQKRVVIVGAGFGGLSAAKGLAKTPIEVTIIDRRNYHLFQPLLYQVATAALSPADIATPIRSIVRNQRNTTVLLGRVTGVDVTERAVLIGERRIPYDYLILATGSRHAYFGHDEWEAVAPGLKKIEDATDIRRRVLLAFEQAETATDPEERQKLLNFIVIGGGPTGVELAGAIAELAHKVLAADFRNIDSRCARVVLIEAGPRLLPAFPQKLSAIAKRSLERLGVEVRLGAPVTACDARGVEQAGERIHSQCVVWAAGVMASPAANWLDAEKDRTGRVKVAPDLSVPGHADIFVIGDTALMNQENGTPVPGIAPAAKQMGYFVARLIRDRLKGRAAAERFTYRHSGNLATIGRKSAVADFEWIRISGFVAWLLWGAVHIYFLIGFRNRLSVLLNWIWAYTAFRRGPRLITGPTP